MSFPVSVFISALILASIRVLAILNILHLTLSLLSVSDTSHLPLSGSGKDLIDRKVYYQVSTKLVSAAEAIGFGSHTFFFLLP